MEMVEDLKMVINVSMLVDHQLAHLKPGCVHVPPSSYLPPPQVFFQPMLRLNLLSAEEHCRIFGNIQNLLPLHEGQEWAAVVHV